MQHSLLPSAGFFRSMDPEGTGTAVMNLTEVSAVPSVRALG